MKQILLCPVDIPAYLDGLSGVYGQEICIEDPVDGSKYFTYVYKADATAKGEVLIWGKTGTASGKNPTAIDPATTATPLQAWCGVAQHATTAAGGVWCQTKGRCRVILLDGATDVVDGDLLEATAASNYATKDAAFGQSTIGISEEAEAKSIAEQVAAGETTSDHVVFLFGNLVTL